MSQIAFGPESNKNYPNLFSSNERPKKLFNSIPFFIASIEILRRISKIFFPILRELRSRLLLLIIFLGFVVVVCNLIGSIGGTSVVVAVFAAPVVATNEIIAYS